MISTTETVLEVKNLTVHLGRDNAGKNILDAVDIRVGREQVVGVIGESGSGKSVLCQALVDTLPGPLTVTEGEILFEGQDIRVLSAKQLQEVRGNRIGYIGSNPFSALDPTMTVGSQLVEKLQVKIPGTGSREARDRVISLLEAVRIPDATLRINEFPHQYSGGMIQRAMIVDALLTEPDLVIADNVTLPLDVTVAAQILRLFHDLRKRVNASFVFVSSSLPVVSDVADELYVLQNGRIIENGKASEVIGNPTSAYTQHLVRSLPKIWTLAPEERHRGLVDSQKQMGEILTLEGVAKTYQTRDRNSFFGRNNVRAVREVTFSTSRGESFGLVGESGCGKSTLSRLMTWLEKPDEGKITFLGRDIQKLSRKEQFELRRRFQLLLQDPYNSIPPHYTIGRTITEPLLIHENISASEARTRGLSVMREVGLPTHYYDELPGPLSAGERQRVNIARALILEPDLMIFDETLTSLDHGQQESILALLETAQRKHDLTYIYISHDLGMVRRACDRVAVMYLGEIVELGDTEQIFKAPTHPYTRALLSALSTLEEKPFDETACLVDGEPPSPINLPEGCSFANRCPSAMDICRKVNPPVTVFNESSVRRCHLQLPDTDSRIAV